MSYENHAWRHRPKAQGGTDPINIPTAKWATVEKGAASVSYSGGYYTPRWQSLATNDTAAFEFSGVSGGLADWVQLNVPGYYHVWSMISNFTAGYWGPEATSIQTGFKSGSAFELLSAGASLADFNLEFSRADDQLASSAETNSTLFNFNAFHWEPGGSGDLDGEDPLLLKTRILSDGDQGAKSLYVLMHIVRVTDPGYTLVSP